MDPTLTRLRRLFQDKLAAKQDQVVVSPGLLGRVSDQLVEVASRPGYVYVRIGNSEAQGQVRNKRTPSTYNLPVYVGIDQITGEYEVLGIRQSQYIGAGYDQIPEIGPHHKTHEWPSLGDTTSDGSDATFIHWRQIRYLRVTVVSGFTVRVDRAPLYRDGVGWTWVTEQTLNLTSLKPTSGARYVLLYLDADAVFLYRAGTLIQPAADLAFSDIPAPLSGEMPLAAVLLSGSQTALVESRTRQDITDLRFPQTSQAQQAAFLEWLAWVESELDYDITRLLVEELPVQMTRAFAEVEAELDFALSKHVVEG